MWNVILATGGCLSEAKKLALRLGKCEKVKKNCWDLFDVPKDGESVGG